MKFNAIIPARYASTRFPGKPLAKIGTQTMIERVYRQVSQVLENVTVATDDYRIHEAVTQFGGKVVLTSACHPSGTDRCLEAALKTVPETERAETVIVNIQGDEPFIQPQQIQELISCFENPKVQIASLYQKLKTSEEIQDPNKVKVVLNHQQQALYFSRAAIPFQKGISAQEWTNAHQYYGHIGVYAYQLEALRSIVALPTSALEQAESLEQLRWLENGWSIQMKESQFSSHGIDTPEDLQAALKFLK